MITSSASHTQFPIKHFSARHDRIWSAAWQIWQRRSMLAHLRYAHACKYTHVQSMHSHTHTQTSCPVELCHSLHVSFTLSFFPWSLHAFAFFCHSHNLTRHSSPSFCLIFLHLLLLFLLFPFSSLLILAHNLTCSPLWAGFLSLSVAV